MRLLAGVSADVSCLVLEAVEGPFAEGALVGPRQLRLIVRHLSYLE